MSSRDELARTANAEPTLILGGHDFASITEVVAGTGLTGGGTSGIVNVDLDQAAPVTNASAEQLLALEDALCKLDEDDPTAAKVFKLRYFAGLSVEQAADLLGVSRATAYRHWTFARAWLQSQMSAGHS